MSWACAQVSIAPTGPGASIGIAASIGVAGPSIGAPGASIGSAASTSVPGGASIVAPGVGDVQPVYFRTVPCRCSMVRLTRITVTTVAPWPICKTLPSMRTRLIVRPRASAIACIA